MAAFARVMAAFASEVPSQDPYSLGLNLALRGKKELTMKVGPNNDRQIGATRMATVVSL